MRLDLFLKTSRLIVRRSLAQDFCDAGAVLVNGAPAKSSKEVKEGDEITIKRRNRLTKVEVAAIPAKKQISKADADDLYRVLEETAIEEIGGLT